MWQYFIGITPCWGYGALLVGPDVCWRQPPVYGCQRGWVSGFGDRLYGGNQVAFGLIGLMVGREAGELIGYPCSEPFIVWRLHVYGGAGWW